MLPDRFTLYTKILLEFRDYLVDVQEHSKQLTQYSANYPTEVHCGTCW